MPARVTECVSNAFPSQSPWSRVGAVAGIEFALCRVTDLQPAWDDWLGAALWMGLSGAWLAVSDRQRPSVRLSMEWAWLGAHLMLAALPYHRALGLAYTFTGLWLLVVVGAGFARVHRESEPLRARYVALGLPLVTLTMAYLWRLRELAAVRSFTSLDLLPFAAPVVVLLVAALLDRWAFLVAAVALVPQAEPEWTATGPVPVGPDIVLVSIDTLRYDAAQTMAVFEGLVPAQAPAPWTLPSMSTLLTGVQPGRHGALVDGQGNPSPMQTDIRTLAERLADAGWDTAGSLENPFVNPFWGFGRGVALLRYTDARITLPRALESRHAHTTGEIVLSALGVLPARRGGVDERCADLLEFHADLRDRPLFTWIHVLDAHLPYRHVMSADGLSLSDRLRLRRGNRHTEGDAPGEAFLTAMRVGYDHEVRYIDEVLTATLASLPSAPNGRIVVLTADHGEEFGEHEGWEHGHDLYQSLLRVPLRIDGVKLIAGPATLADVVPTLLAAVGLPAEGTDGVNLAEPRPVDRALPSANVLYGDPTLSAVRVGDRKLIDGVAGPRAFDLAADPGELHPSDDATLAPLLPRLAPARAGRGAGRGHQAAAASARVHDGR